MPAAGRVLQLSIRIARAARTVIRASFLRPGHSVITVLILAVGSAIGMVTFAVVDAVVLRPLPLRHSSRIVSITVSDAKSAFVAPRFYEQLKDHLQSVDVIAARSVSFGTEATVGTVTKRWSVSYSSSDMFRLLEWSPAIGRFWDVSEDKHGAPVAVISHGLWRRQFGSRSTVLGETVAIGAEQYRVIGVLPIEADHPEFEFTSTPIWLPMAGPSFGVYARMKPGVTTAVVEDEVQRLIGESLFEAKVVRLVDVYTAPVHRWMLLALLAAGLLMLAAVLNAASLIAAGREERDKDTAVQTALGASGSTLAVDAAVEGFLYSVAAIAVALVLSIVGVNMVKAAINSMLPGLFRAETIAINGRVLLAAGVACAAVCILVSVVPMWRAWRVSPAFLLRSAGGETVTRRWRLRAALLGSEIALVTVLLVIALLIVISLRNVLTVDLGLSTEGLIGVMPRLPFQAPVAEVRTRIAALPGVTGVAVSTGASLPFFGRAFGGAWRETLLSRGDRQELVQAKALDYRVSANYFEVAGMTFLSGGSWSTSADATSQFAVIDERLAQALFGNEVPVGQLVLKVEPPSEFVITGVVRFVPARGPEAESLPSAYFSQVLSPNRTFAGLLVRTSSSQNAILPAIEQALKPVAPTQDEPYVFSAASALGRLTALRRFTASATATFAAVSLIIGAFGIYAILSAVVVRQATGIGVRIALGATPVRIGIETIGAVWRPVAIGFGMGAVVSWWLSAGLTAMLFGVAPTDLSVYVLVGTVLLVVSILAVWLPAWSASRVDPVVALRGSVRTAR